MPTAWPARQVLRLIFFAIRHRRAAVGDDYCLVVKRIVRFRDALIGAAGRSIDLRRTFHIQGFVWALVVKLFQKGVELGLLLQQIGAGGALGFFLSVKCMRSRRPYCCG